MTIAKQTTALALPLPAARTTVQQTRNLPDGGFNKVMTRLAQGNASSGQDGKSDNDVPVKNAPKTDENDGSTIVAEGIAPLPAAQPPDLKKGQEVTAQFGEEAQTDAIQSIAVLPTVGVPKTPSGPEHSVLVPTISPGISLPVQIAARTPSVPPPTAAVAPNAQATGAEIPPDSSDMPRAQVPDGTAAPKIALPADLVAGLRLQVTQTPPLAVLPPPRAIVPRVLTADMANRTESALPKTANPNVARALDVAPRPSEIAHVPANDAEAALSVQMHTPSHNPAGLADPSPAKPPIAAPHPFHNMGEVLTEMGRSGRPGPIEIALAPEELGRVRLHMIANGDNMRVHIMVERPETMDLFRRGAEGFLNDLRQAGFSGATLNFSGWDNNTPSRPQAPAPLSTEDVAVAALPDTPPFRRAAPSGSGLYLRL